MSEPIKLTRGDETLIVYAPRYAAQLVAEDGWKVADAKVRLPDVQAEEAATTKRKVAPVRTGKAK
jgi:hypothetical protein